MNEARITGGREKPICRSQFHWDVVVVVVGPNFRANSITAAIHFVKLFHAIKLK